MTLAASLHLSSLHWVLTTSTSQRLLTACGLGGVIGIEREWRHKDAGLRTSMLVCMAAALFTIVGGELAGNSEDKSRVASNIVQGIGFLGAGLILHAKDRVIGLTSAATVFVVAAIGMTCGAGLYLEALFSTAIVMVALQVVGGFEARLGWKRYPMLYEVRAAVSTAPEAEDAARKRVFTAVLKVLDAAGHRLQVLDRDTVAGLERLSFSLTATHKRHAKVLEALRASDATDQVVVFRDLDDE